MRSLWGLWMTAPGTAKTAIAAALTASMACVVCAPAQAAAPALTPLAPLPSVSASVDLTPPAIPLLPSRGRHASASASPSAGSPTGSLEATGSASLPLASAQLGAGVSQSGSHAGIAATTPSSGAGQPPRQASPAGSSAKRAVTPTAGSAAKAGAATGSSASTTARDSHVAGEEVLEQFAAQQSARHRGGLSARGAGGNATTHAAASIVRLASASPVAAPTALPRSAGVRVSSGDGSDLPSLNLPPAGGEALEVALIVVGAMLLTALLFADDLKLGERYRDLRARVSHRRLG